MSWCVQQSSGNPEDKLLVTQRNMIYNLRDTICKYHLDDRQTSNKMLTEDQVVHYTADISSL